MIHENTGIAAAAICKIDHDVVDFTNHIVQVGDRHERCHAHDWAVEQITQTEEKKPSVVIEECPQCIGIDSTSFRRKLPEEIIYLFDDPFVGTVSIMSSQATEGGVQISFWVHTTLFVTTKIR